MRKDSEQQTYRQMDKREISRRSDIDRESEERGRQKEGERDIQKDRHTERTKKT